MTRRKLDETLTKSRSLSTTQREAFFYPACLPIQFRQLTYMHFHLKMLPLGGEMRFLNVCETSFRNEHQQNESVVDVKFLKAEVWSKR